MITPLGTNIVIEPETIDQSALRMVDENEAKTEIAKVISVGNEVTKVEIGDRILYKGYSKDEILVDNKTITIIPENEVKAIIT